MPLIGFACPLCGGCFALWLDYIPDGNGSAEICPYCKKEVKLTPDNITAESCVQVIDFDDQT